MIIDNFKLLGLIGLSILIGGSVGSLAGSQRSVNSTITSRTREPRVSGRRGPAHARKQARARHS